MLASPGSISALGVAATRPELVRRLVLMGSAGLNAELSPALMPIVQYDFTPAGMRKLIAALTADGFEIDDDLVEYRHARSIDPATRAAYGATMGWIKAQGGLFYVDDFIRRVSVPTLVVNGKLDLGKYTIRNAAIRLRRLRTDPLAGVLDQKPDILAVLERLATRLT